MKFANPRALKAGYRYEWESPGIGRHRTTIKAVHPATSKLFGLFKKPRRYELETVKYPTGYPEHGTPYGTPTLSGVFAFDDPDFTLTLSIGYFKGVVKGDLNGCPRD